MSKQNPIPHSLKVKMYELYKLENKRAAEVAELFGVSVQHVFRIIREMEGKTNWKKPKGNVFFSRPVPTHFKNKYRIDYIEEAPLEERRNTYTPGAKRVDADVYKDR